MHRIAAVFVVAMVWASGALAQDVGQDPLAPVAPKSDAECFAYRDAMSARMSQLNRAHQSCVDQVRQACNASNANTLGGGDRCINGKTNPGFYRDIKISQFAECQYLKDAWYRAEAAKAQGVPACTQEVAAYLQANSANNASSGSGRPSSTGSSGTGSSNSGGSNRARRGPVTVDQAPGAGIIGQIGAALSALATPSSPRETSESTPAGPGIEVATPSFQPLLGPGGASKANDPALDATIDGILNPGTPGGSWMDAVVSNLVEKDGKDPWNSIGFATLAGVGASPAAIPFELLAPIFDANMKALDQTFLVMQNFENARPGDVDRIWSEYQAQVLTPEQFLKTIVKEVMVGYAANQVSEKLVMPLLNPTLTDGQPTTFHWWTDRGALRETTLRRDGKGVPLLRNDAGELYRYDPSTNSVGYTAREAEEFVSSGYYRPVWNREYVERWERNSIIFLPTERERLGPRSEQFVSSAAEAWIGYRLGTEVDRAEKIGNDVSQTTREKLTHLKKWLDEERQRNGQ